MDWKRIVIVCDCGDNHHMFCLKYFPPAADGNGWVDEAGLYASVQLSPLPFWSRVKCAILYIFNRDCRYGNWDEIIINRTDAAAIRDLMNEFIGPDGRSV